MAFTVSGAAQDTWTVAGSSSDVFGTTWDTSNTANDMTYDSGTGLWTLTKSDVTLNVGEVYKCKVLKNHSWDVSYPEQDVTFSVGATGVYSVTVTYNPENNIVSIIIPGAPHTYTVAGSSATLFENTWNPENENNDMAKNNAGLYEWSKSNVSLAAGNIEFKVVAERNWDLAYPNDNYILNIPSAGNYDVVITFNDETREINATATASIASVQIFGSWNNWDSADPINLTAGINNTYTGTISYTTATAEEFKLVVNETWLGYDKVALAENYNFVSQGSDNNFKLSEAYLSYDITATWTPSADASAGWTLTIVPGDERPKYTYTATFVNGANWENVYAYIWKVDGDNNVKLNGDYPGQKLVKSGTETISTVEYDVYTFKFETYDATAVPEFIVFSDGGSTNKTDDLEFVNEKKYTETVPGNAEIESVIVTVPYAPIDPINITNKKQEVDGKYVYSIDMDLSVVLDDIPFNFTINGETLPVSADMLDPSENNLLETISIPISSYLLKNVGSGYAVYTATATWTPNPDATSQWKLLVVGKDQRPEATTYSILYNTTGNAADWKVGDTMTESDGEFTATIKNKPGMLFAIAPTGSVGVMGIQWGQIIRPVTNGNNWEIDFADYNGTTELNANGKVWAIDEANNADVIINFTPGETGTFTITNELEFTIGQYGYSTYSNARKYKVVDAAANFVTVSGSEATLVPQEEGAVLPAMTGAGKGSGIIISGTAGAKATIKSANQSDDAVDSSANLLAGTGDNSYEVGTQFADGDTYTAYILAKPADKDLGFYLLDDSDRTIAAHKAFLAVSGESQAPFFGFGGNDTTGINSVERGALNIEGCYTLDGRRVEQPTKGLYIINGKKVLVK